VRRIAAGLAARGFGRGDVLAINAPNAPEWPLPVLGALAAGGTVTTANPLYTADGPELEQAVAERLGCVVGQGYGMTEATACIALPDVEHPETIVRGSVGRLLPGTESRVVDGELWTAARRS
jgi:long-subunit acyl-CoA synthetase (AMP-forming)